MRQEDNNAKSLWKSFFPRVFVVIIVLLFVISIGAYLGVNFFLNRVKNSYTDDKPVQIKQEELTPQTRGKTANVYQKLVKAINTNSREIIVLDSKEFNQLFSYAPETADFSKKASLALDGDYVKAKLTISMNEIIPTNNFPWKRFKNRYLNGDFVLSMLVNDGTISTEIISGVVSGINLEQAWIDKINKNKLIDNKLRTLAGGNNLSQIKSLSIQNSKCTIVTKGK